MTSKNPLRALFVALALLLAAVFAKGPGKPGTYTTRDGRSFRAGDDVPNDPPLPEGDVEQWTELGYITDSDPKRRVASEHDVPKRGQSRSGPGVPAPRSRADTPQGGKPDPGQLRSTVESEDPDNTAPEEDGGEVSEEAPGGGTTPEERRAARRPREGSRKATKRSHAEAEPAGGEPDGSSD